MIRTLPYEPLAAMAVFQALDASDLLEAQLVRGAAVNHLTLFADWHSNQANCLLSLVVTTATGTPFALLALAHTGQCGVAQAAFLSRDHRRYRVPLARAALAIAREMPALAVDAGIGRIECRAWSNHPTASVFLRAIGFQHECDMAGFGLRSDVVFRQFAWTHPAIFPTPPQEQEA
jgi:hypothetical protein